mgnify:CR=1 FL=1
MEEGEIVSFEISSLPTGTMKISTKKNIWRYLWSHYEISYFMKQEGFGLWSKIIYRFQIESDGLIYILRDTDSFKLNELSNQPIGYPLKPREF